MNEVLDSDFTQVADMRLVLRDIMMAIEKELPEPGKPIPELYIESKIIIKLATKGYKIQQMEMK